MTEHLKKKRKPEKYAAYWAIFPHHEANGFPKEYRKKT